VDTKITTFRRKTENARLFLSRLPLFALFGPLLVLNKLPRRPPDLRRLTKSAAFLALDATAAAWSGEHFRRIEEAAPWLHRVGEHVLDFCTCGLEQRKGVMPLWPLARWETNCRRETTVTYGFDGDADDRLDALADALDTAGWGTTAAYRPGWLRDSPGLVSWRPSGEFTCPPALERVWPPDQKRRPSVGLSIGWTDDQDPESGSPLGPHLTWRPADLTASSPLYQPVTLVDGDGTAMARTDSMAHRYEHQLAMRIELDYLPSAGFTGRIPKSLRPIYPHRHW
jgi:hypothetical protein